jgi:tetratricopeptide (TPR) repeat protein
MNEPRFEVAPGDVIARQDSSSLWHVVKILDVDWIPDGPSTAHCLRYNAAHDKPTADSLATLGVQIWHYPVSAASFDSGWTHISNEAVSKDELEGFIEYLKHTDYLRYIALTKQDLKEVVRKANEHYQRACGLGDQGQRAEAIAEYSEAIDLFPLFYEAIDNRAFTYMELGNYKEGLADFERSLRVNPNGVAAFFSKGECLLRLGQIAQAEAVFAEGVTRFPEQRADFEKYVQIARAAQG